MRNTNGLEQRFVAPNYFNFAYKGIGSTTWSWKTIPAILKFEGWTICRKTRTATKCHRQSHRLVTYETNK